MNLNTCIQQSNGQYYQNLAVQKYSSTAHNFITRRVDGVVKAPIGLLVDALKSIYCALKELKLAVTDRTNYKNHLQAAANYVGLATLFIGTAGIAPTINFINPTIFSAVLTAANEAHDTATKALQAEHDKATNTLKAEHDTATTTLKAEHKTALEGKDKETNNIRRDHQQALITKDVQARQLNKQITKLQLKSAPAPTQAELAKAKLESMGRMKGLGLVAGENFSNSQSTNSGFRLRVSAEN